MSISHEIDIIKKLCRSGDRIEVINSVDNNPSGPHRHPLKKILRISYTEKFVDSDFSSVFCIDSDNTLLLDPWLYIGDFILKSDDAERNEQFNDYILTLEILDI